MPLRSPEWYRARIDLTTATLRHKWASGEAKSSGLTPELAIFKKDAAKECRALRAILIKLPPAKPGRLDSL